MSKKVFVVLWVVCFILALALIMMYNAEVKDNNSLKETIVNQQKVLAADKTKISVLEDEIKNKKDIIDAQEKLIESHINLTKAIVTYAESEGFDFGDILPDWVYEK